MYNTQLYVNRKNLSRSNMQIAVSTESQGIAKLLKYLQYVVED